MATPDRIEREIVIDAPLDRVWRLVTEAGWRVRDGDRSHQRRVAFRWAFAYPGQEPRAGNSTLVEFFLSERGGGTLVRVVETGFSSLPEGLYDGNVKGWARQLEVLRRSAA